MCQAFSCLITKSKKVYYKVGMDSHDTIQSFYQKKDKELKDDKLPPNNTFARVEITPKNNDYLKPDKWVLKVDEEVKPTWWNNTFEKPCFVALDKWKEKVYGQINLKELNNPVNPFKLTLPKKITHRHLSLLKEWASVWVSVRDSVRDSAWDSVGDSVWASVRDSAWDSVWAYLSYSFPKIKNWKYIDKRKAPFNKIKGNPFRSSIKLWKMGLVASYDSYNKVWRLHGGLKAEVLWQGSVSDLKKL